MKHIVSSDMRKIIFFKTMKLLGLISIVKNVEIVVYVATIHGLISSCDEASNM